MCLRIGHTVDAAYEHIQTKRQGAASSLPDTPLVSAAASVISDMIPSRSPFTANDRSVQNVPATTATHQAASGSSQQRPVNMGNSDPSMTNAVHCPTAWPYPPTSNETRYLQQHNDPNAYAWQPTEDDVQTNHFGPATPVSPMSTCSSSRTSDTQNSYIQQPYSREHLFFESTPRDTNNQAMSTNPP